jgi:hypothetical protein
MRFLFCFLLGLSQIAKAFKSFGSHVQSKRILSMDRYDRLSDTNVHRRSNLVQMMTDISTQKSSFGSSRADNVIGPLSAGYRRHLSYMQIFQIHLDAMYNDSLQIKCPFFRRRATDSVDGLASVVQFILARHKSLPIPVLPGQQIILNSMATKSQGLSIEQISNILLIDWRGQVRKSDLTSGKGYYITGKLTKEIYRDDCFFNGPDPDMPVTGLKKYISSTSQLFDHKTSKAELISLKMSEEDRTVTVQWRLEGILNLPWHPKLKPWTGQTTYFIDGDGLIDRHEELWDISVIDAFVSTLFPFLNYGAPPACPVE